MSKLGDRSTAKDVVDHYAPDKELAGRVAVVTGGNSGIGLETVKALALAGCSVVLASRSVEAGEKAVAQEVRQKGVSGYAVPDASVDVEELDLSDLSSVVAFAKKVRETQERIDYLVLNAGVMALPHLERTADGFEKQIGVNHFGHALLTRLLLPTLEAQTFPARIVSLASVAHNYASDFNVEDLHYHKAKYDPWKAYGHSKLANVLFAKGLVKRLPADGRISSVSVHPGIIHTALWRSTPAQKGIGGRVTGKEMEWPCLLLLAEAFMAATDSQLDAALEKKGFAPDGGPLESGKTEQ